jgi:hypothetical protein
LTGGRLLQSATLVTQGQEVAKLVVANDERLAGKKKTATKKS